MSLDLDQLTKAIQDFRGPIADSNGRMTAEFKRIFYGVVTESSESVTTAQSAAETAQTAATTAQSSATTAQSSAAAAQSSADSAATAASNAAGSSSYGIAVPNQQLWWADGTGTYPASDPTADITITFYDQDDAVIATRVLRGTLTTATGLIAVTNVSSTGLTTAYTLTGDGSSSVIATVTVTLSDGSIYRTRASWSAISVAGPGGVGL